MPTPHSGEKKSDYISRCIPYVMKEHKGMKSNQAAAICYGLWDDHHIKSEATKLLNIIKEIKDIKVDVDPLEDNEEEKDVAAKGHGKTVRSRQSGLGFGYYVQ